jgi:hypothetical protein
VDVLEPTKDLVTIIVVIDEQIHSLTHKKQRHRPDTENTENADPKVPNESNVTNIKVENSSMETKLKKYLT